MKVKKFVAKNMPEAMLKIREELGRDAVILNSKRVVTGGILGFFTKNNIEVIAAIDPEVNQKKNRQHRERKPVRKEKASQEKKRDEVNDVSVEISQLKDLILNMNNRQTLQSSTDYPEGLQKIYKRLVFQEINELLRLKIMKQLLKRWYSLEGEEQSEEVILKWTEEELGSCLKDAEYGPFTYNKRFLNVVGPTGVGKTTTLAKIAAKAVLTDKKKAAFITTDTYRIAAIEQLKTYGNILNIPVEVAYSVDDFKKAKEKLADYDFILVDSAGRNFRNSAYVEQLSEVIDFNEEMETHLVLALTSKYQDMTKIIEQFQLIKPDKIIFTKADETESHGSIINIHDKYKIGTSYVTTGQNVPDDIMTASKDLVVNLVLGDEQ